MYVCFCAAVTDRAIADAVAGGAATIEDVTASCRAGSGCGGCRESIESLLARREGSEAGSLRARTYVSR
jgi:bacterioferritin-associated ferredoxin